MKFLITSDTHRGYSVKTDAIFRHKFLPKCQEEKPDCIIHAGDWGLIGPHQTISGFKLFREYFPNTPIIAVLGNHDYWGLGDRYHPRPKSVRETEDKIRAGAKECEIKLLDGEAVQVGGVTIYGFDGWYSEINPPTNDHRWVPDWIEDSNYLRKKADAGFNNILDMKRTADICLTHFPPYTFNQAYAGFCADFNFMGPICDTFAHLIVGHSHQQEDFYQGACRVINPGSDYDKPKYHILWYAEKC